MYTIPNKARHGNAAVLDLRMPQKANGRLIGLTPELLLRKFQRIPVAKRPWVFLSKFDKIVERLHAGICMTHRRLCRRESDWSGSIILQLQEVGKSAACLHLL